MFTYMHKDLVGADDLIIPTPICIGSSAQVHQQQNQNGSAQELTAGKSAFHYFLYCINHLKLDQINEAWPKYSNNCYDSFHDEGYRSRLASCLGAAELYNSYFQLGHEDEEIGL